MAEQKLTIKLNIDTSDSAKLATVTTQVVNLAETTKKAYDNSSGALNRLNELDTVRLSLIAQQEAALARTSGIIERANVAITSGARGANLGLQNSINSAKKLTETYATTIPILQAVEREINKIVEANRKAASDLAKNMSQGSFIPRQSSQIRGDISSGMTASGQASSQANQLARELVEQQRYFSSIGTLNEAYTTQYLNGIRRREEAERLSMRATQADYERLFGLQGNLAQRMSQGSTIPRQNSEVRGSISAGMSSAGNQAAQATREATTALNQHANASRNAEDAHRSLVTRIVEGVSIYRVYNTILNTISNSIRSIPKIGIELDATRASLEATVGSGSLAESALKGLKEEALRTGIEIGVLRESFRSFQASTSLAGATLESTWHMFTNLNTVITGLHLSTAKANGIFLAMAQIFNKGKVQSEELVKQLGNLLPGAFASMAASIKNLDGTIGITGEELSRRMKAGIVTAQDVMENFTEYMKVRFSPSFELASQGLNSNIGRMQNSFTYLGEAIYASTSGPMVTFTKGVTSMTNYLTAAVEGTNDFGKYLKILGNIIESLTLTVLAGYIKGLFTATVALDAMGVATVRASAAARGFQAALAFLSAPTALIAGIISIGIHIAGVMREAESLNTRIQALKDAEFKQAKADTPALKLQLSIDEDPTVKAADRDIVELQARIDKLNEFKVPVGKSYDKLREKHLEEVRVENTRMLTLENTRNSAIEAATVVHKSQQLEEDKKFNQLSISAAAAKEEAILASKIAAGDHAKSAQEAYNTAILESEKRNLANINALEQAKTKIGSANTPKELENLKVINESLERFKEGTRRDGDAAREAWENAQLAKTKKGTSELDKVRKDGYAEEKFIMQDHKRENDIASADDDNRYKLNLISIKDYYANKKLYIEADAAFAVSSAQRNLDAANKGGKASEVNKARAELEKAKDEGALKQTQNRNAEKVDIDTIQRKYIEAEATYLESQGKMQEAANRRLQANPEIELFKAQKTAAGELAASQLEYADKIKTVEGEINLLRQDRLMQDKAYSRELERINILVSTGGMSKLTGMRAQDKATDKQIAGLKETIRLENEKIKLVPENSGKSATILKIQKEGQAARDELFKLEATGSSVANMFSDVLGSAFDQPFANLVQGTMTAKQAFASFSSAIQAEIMKIVAAEVRSAIIGSVLKPLIGAGLSALGGAMSGVSGLSGFGGYSGVPLQSAINPAANGGVFSGAGISSHSGTIVSSPTLFPFAKGTGLMGEAGPEAILPLKRNSQGKLGVSLDKSGHGASSGGIIIQNLSVNVQEKEGSTSQEQAKLIGETIKMQLKTLMQQELVTSSRSGGTLNPTSMVASF
jgi:tape measure domain-containing protein